MRLKRTNEVQEAECLWILRDELPTVYRDIGISLTNTIHLLSIPKNAHPRQTRPTNVPISSPSGCLRGSIAVGGTQIVKASIERVVKQSKKSSKEMKTFETNIVKSPYLLSAVCLEEEEERIGNRKSFIIVGVE
eukprot:m.22606 g.22606  ORF g.22606 m.22606 type:complete len:134 (+) comp8865_c0_seq4:114-515(+)